MKKTFGINPQWIKAAQLFTAKPSEGRPSLSAVEIQVNPDESSNEVRVTATDAYKMLTISNGWSYYLANDENTYLINAELLSKVIKNCHQRALVTVEENELIFELFKTSGNTFIGDGAPIHVPLEDCRYVNWQSLLDDKPEMGFDKPCCYEAHFNPLLLESFAKASKILSKRPTMTLHAADKHKYFVKLNPTQEDYYCEGILMGITK